VQRRSHLTAATARQIVDVGLEGTTMRSVARAAGSTTGALSHYFVDKRDLLLATFHSRADMARARIDASCAAGATLLEAVIDSALPLDDERLTDWHVFLAFFGAAIGDDELTRAQQARLGSYRQLVVDALTAEVAAGRLRPDIDTARVSRELVALINGIAVQAVFDGIGWPPDEQRRIVGDHLAALRTDNTSPGAEHDIG
jgi:AcrR family transcriptional regulator